ncbi:RHS repeat-associated core domain-containing protein [Sorangium sp. So ce1078]|uniref:RHS repeat-associated core domain-containing protein n=1 Tax=Sorangium sp. So ce1078 TaxID=3133329 RepID=UPI003F621A9E
MARTAPFPNAMVIPGMNPGVLILGGGGGGGGGNGRGGNGRGDGQGGDGKGGGSGPRGGGKDAGSCGPGSGGGCPNPTHGSGGGTHAGDPVDPITGRVYTVAVVDLALPGPIPLVIKRSYSSALSEEDRGLGFGWTHSLSWQVEDGRRGLRVLEPHAAVTELPMKLDPGESARLPCGVLTRYAWGYALAAEGLAYLFAEPQGSRWQLSRIIDLHDNTIELSYEEGRLARVLDSAGRVVRVRRHGDGRIAAFEVKNASAQGRWEARRRYTFDARGDLVVAEDAAGHAHRFAYDDDHRLARREEPGGLVVEFRYKDRRCIETWCHRDGNDALDDGLPESLHDGSRARGFLHVKIEHDNGALTEVITSRAVRRLDGNAFGKLDRMVWGGGSGVHTFRYDDAGALLEYQDAMHQVLRWERDAEGRLLAEVDPMGNRTRYEHDARGFVSTVTDALGGSARYERDARGDVVAVHDDVGFVVGFAYDSRGLLVGALLPNGGGTRMEYDALANRVRVVEPDGSERRIRYDFLGRVLGFTDARGHETRFAYDDCGRLCAVFGPGGAVTRYDFDVDGNLAKITDADGRATTLRWGGFHVLTELVRPDGSKVRYRYDREQDLVRIVNEAGEEHRFVRDGEGRITGERTFDGREIAYRLDLQGRITQMRCGRIAVDFEYDALGRLVRRGTSDGREDVFDYDPLGRIERAVSGDVECAYTYDRRGRVTTEVTRRGGEVLAASAWTYDAMGKAVGVRGPGGDLRVQRDVMGRPEAVLVGDQGLPVRFAYDAGGFEIERILPGGGKIAAEINAEGLLERQRVLGKPSASRVGPGEPAWVGPLPAPETWRKNYAWSPAGLLRADEPLGGDIGELLRDANGRIVERRRAGNVAERFGFTATGDLQRAGEQRAYARGGRLTARAVGRETVRYEYNERGDVVRKRVSGRDDGEQGEQERERVWTYDWSGDGRLMEARTPDGRTITFAYDAFGRRIEKHVARLGKVESVTRYTFRGDALVHERRERAQGAGAPVVEERSYVTLPESPLPLAQMDGAAGAFRYFVHGVNGFPEALVEGDGRVAAGIEAGLKGDVPAEHAGLTPLRFPGQYADEETGLYYNWRRYYDPETGTYLSPEPLGIEGSLKPYAYVDNYPMEWVDADGLARMECTITRTDGSTIVGASRGRRRSDLHPAVQAALPPSNARGQDANVQPQNCAEPQALSDHLEDWQNRTGQSCRPGDPDWRRNLHAAMSEIDPNGGIASSMGGTPRASCPNCSQTIPRLYALAGMEPPNRVIAPGYQEQERNGPRARTTRPADGFLSDQGNRAASSFSDPRNRGGAPGHVPGRGGLGTWTYDEERGFWHRH